MAEPVPVNVRAFQPYNGGQGIRLAVSSSSGTTAVSIPGLAGGTDGDERKRVLITNPSVLSVFVRLGQSGVQANLNSLELLPGCAYLLTPPPTNPTGVFIAARTESGTANISACAGDGT